MDFFLLFDKPKYFTSFELIARLRKIFNEKKIGHSGTLDKIATGLLIVAVGGQATKMLEFLINQDKEYEAKMLIGVKSDTYDISGSLEFEKGSFDIQDEIIFDALKSFEGEIIQKPPLYSAIKINGKRASDRVRNGEVVEIKERNVRIYKIKNSELSYQSSEDFVANYPNLKIPNTLYTIPYTKFTVHCSSGTYIRSLINDVGFKMNRFSLMSELRRTQIMNFSINNAVTLEQLIDLRSKQELDDLVNLNKSFISLSKMAEILLPRIDLDDLEFEHVKYGRMFLDRWNDQNLVAAFYQNKFVSILQKDLEYFKVYKNFC